MNNETNAAPLPTEVKKTEQKYLKLLRPCVAGPVTDNFAEHKNRAVPSVNPGTDFAVGYGTPIVAAHGGIVAIADSNPDGSGGRMVAIKNGDHETQYLHLSKVLVKNGQKLKQGAKIGLAGGSGFGKDRHYGTHLHFAYKVKGKNVDPEKYIAK